VEYFQSYKEEGARFEWGLCDLLFK